MFRNDLGAGGNNVRKHVFSRPVVLENNRSVLFAPYREILYTRETVICEVSGGIKDTKSSRFAEGH